MRNEKIDKMIDRIRKHSRNEASLQSALENAANLCKDNPRSPQAMVLYAELLQRNNRMDESRKACSKTLDLLVDISAAIQRGEEQPFVRKTVDELIHLCSKEGMGALDVIFSCFTFLCYTNMATSDDLILAFKTFVSKCEFQRWKDFSEPMSKSDSHTPVIFMFQSTSLVYDKDLKASYKKIDKLFKDYNRKNSWCTDCSLVHLSILERLKKFQVAIAILREGYQGGDEYRVRALNPTRHEDLKRAIKYTEGRLLLSANQTRQAANIFKELFENSQINKFPNNLECFLHYISCLLNDNGVLLTLPIYATINPMEFNIHPLKLTLRNVSPLPKAEFLNRMTTIINSVQSLRSHGEPDITRFYYLALLETVTRKFKNGYCDSTILADLLLNFFQGCGHFLCFPFDVETFFHVFTDEEKKNLLRDFEARLDDNDDSNFLSKKESIFKIRKLLGLMFDLPISDLERDVIDMSRLFIRSLPLLELEFEQNIPGEDLPCLVCDLLVQLYCRSQHLSYLVQAVFVLEFGLKVRSGVSKYIILLVHLYSHLGAYQLASERYNLLNFENRRMVFSQLLTSPFLAETFKLLVMYIKDQKTYFQEMADSIYSSYCDGDFLKVIEGIQLVYRLERCYKHVMPVHERDILKLKLRAGSFEFFKTLQNLKLPPCDDSMDEFVNDLTFQKSIESSPWWSPTPWFNFLLESPEHYTRNNPIFGKPNLITLREDSKKIEDVRIRRRSLLPSLVLSSISSSIPPHQLDSLLNEYANCGGSSLGAAEKNIIQISAGKETLKGMEMSDSDTLDLMTMAVFLNVLKWDSPDSTENWSILDNFLRKVAEEKMASILQFMRCPGAYVSFFVQMVTETFCWHIFAIKAFITRLESAKGKEGDTQVILKSIESLHGIVEDLQHYFKEDDNRWKLLDLGFEGSSVIPRNLSATFERANFIHGDRIEEAMRLSLESIEENIKEGMTETLSEVLRMCEIVTGVLFSLKEEVKL